MCFALVADVESHPDVTSIYYMTTLPIVGWQFDATDGVYSGTAHDAAGDFMVFAEDTGALGFSLTLTPIEPGTGLLVRLGWDELSADTVVSAIGVLEDATKATSFLANDGGILF